MNISKSTSLSLSLYIYIYIYIDWLLIIRKPDLSNEIKWDFFQVSGWIITDQTYREKARWELHKNAVSYIEQILAGMSS